MKATLLLMLGCLISFQLSATTNAGNGQKWYGPYTITKVARYYDGGHRTSVHMAEPPKTTCNVTNNQKKVTYYANRKSQAYADSMFSAAAAAQAQNKKVMLLLDRACHETYGLNVHGVEILSE
nr:hypothetical protein [uncultured Vibrio sp.]